MPEYVIAGVEKATTVAGERLPTQMAAASALPVEVSGERPALAGESALIALERPSLLKPLGDGYVRASLTAGTKEMAEVEGELTGQMLPTSYLVSIAGTFPPNRLSIFQSSPTTSANTRAGMRSDYHIEAALARDLQSQVIVSPSVSFRDWRFDRLLKDSAPVRRSVVELSLDAATTPIDISNGSLLASFRYGVTDFGSDGNQSSSMDRLRLRYTRPIAEDQLDLNLEADGEVVSQDAKGHSLFLLNTEYRHPLQSDLQIHGGFDAYFGQSALLAPDLTVGPLPRTYSTTGLGDSRHGLLPQVGAIWQPPFGGIVELEYKPQVIFSSYRELLARWPMMDTASRGVTIEGISRFVFDYRRIIVQGMSAEISLESRTDRHKPYLIYAPNDVWTVVTRRSEALITTLKTSIDLPRSMQLDLHGTLTDEKSVGGPGGEAPFVPPADVGVALWIPVTRDIALSQDFTYYRSSPMSFTTGKTGEQATWNASVKWNARSDLSASLGFDNILNRREMTVPGYDDMPRTLWTRIEWRGISPFIH